MSAPTCPKCKRELSYWPLERGAKCAPKDWKKCIRPDPRATER